MGDYKRVLRVTKYAVEGLGTKSKAGKILLGSQGVVFFNHMEKNMTWDYSGMSMDELMDRVSYWHPLQLQSL